MPHNICILLFVLLFSGQAVSSCTEGYYLPNGGYRCLVCEYDCFLCNSYSECINCVSPECTMCTSTCNIRTCNQRTHCASCIDGYYLSYSTATGTNICRRCYYKGCKCSQTNYCISCLPGKCGFLCTECCNPNCEKCTSTDLCDKCKDGWFGTHCNQSCPENCNYQRCSQDQGLCTAGCISGTFGNTCQHSCITNCNNCSDEFFCDICNPGYYLSNRRCNICQERCSLCNSWNNCTQCSSTNFWGLVCENECSNCITECNKNFGCNGNCADGYYNDWNSIKSGYECQQCPTGCKTCTDKTACTFCVNGYWGNTCQNLCNSNCQNRECNISTGECTDGCVDGYYGETCTSECPTVCRTCSSNSICNACVDGYYNLWNYYKKCDCIQDMCSERNGVTCTSCKRTGWYPSNFGCCPCRSECQMGNCFLNGTCVHCDSTKYGQYCESDCSDRCLGSQCNRDGTCVSCVEGTYGKYCSFSCSYGPLSSRCKKCTGQNTEDVICSQCTDGSYPNDKYCFSCDSRCKDGSFPVCDPSTGACNYGCKLGWFGKFCNTSCRVLDCQECTSNDSDTCQTCKDMFYLISNGSCISCPENCNSVCDRYNGSCTTGCASRWSGQQCNIECPPACLDCDQFDSTVCITCETTYFGNSCENKCNDGCFKEDEGQICNKSNGSCLNGCNIGLWGETCDSDCGSGCNNSICDRHSAVCTNGCRTTHYGSLCNTECSNYCIQIDESSDRICNAVSGMCIFGCIPKYYGERCEKRCSQNCKDGSCRRNNGSCFSGCVDGFEGPMCMQALQSDHQGSDAAAIGGGTSAGVAILIVIVVVVIVVVIRKRKASSKFDAHDGTVGQNQKLSSKNVEPSPVYSNIDEASEHAQIPGVCNLLYANTPIRMSDLSETEDPTVPMVTSKTSRPSSVDYLQEEEMEVGEIVEEEEIEQGGEVDNTYYNVGGKRVAVPKLADYIKSKSEQDLFNDFGKLPTGLLKAHKEARKARNVAKNRYKAIYPYDENRVILQDGGGDYMNASYIDGYNRAKEYIASSGPFKKSYETTPDFWRMIWQERCETIVMLTKPIENNQPKCEKYWPETGENSSYGDITISCLTEDLYADYAIRILTVTKGQECFNIHHVHFTAWPDKGIPHDVTSMIEFIHKVRNIHKVKNTPMLVHCSAGIGRTGTFMVLDMLTYEGEDRGSVDIFGSVASLRYQRCNMVQTPEQYVYLHHAVLHSLTFDCRSIPGDMFLQNYNKLIERNGGERKIDMQFQQLQSISEEITDEERAEKARNKALTNKNRNDADIPADENRVKLHENRKPGSSDYINAVYINSFRKRRKFIAAQSPLPSTVVDFLSLVWQEKCGCIVSMEDPDILDKTVKVYWPADNQVVKHGVFKVTCKDSKTTGNYMTKKLSITYHGSKGEETRDVNLFISTNWPKGSSVPKSSDSLLELVKTVDILNRKSGSEHPILIHCRTGAERSCIFCAVSGLIEKMEIAHELSVVNTLRQIKARRLKAFSTVEEYKFCYQAVISYLKSFEIYSNFQLKETEA